MKFILTLLAAACAAHLPAQTFSVIYNFAGGSDGATPLAGLVMDSQGNLYGTASAGGTEDTGTVYEVTTSGEQHVIYSFAGGNDGQYPQSGLVMDSQGNLYGTTYAGGQFGNGTVFEVSPGGKEAVLHNFAGGKDGANPIGGLIMSADGKLYGTTFWGGEFGGGTAYEVVKGSGERVLQSFGAVGDGANPVAGLTFGLKDKNALYGTTSAGGLGMGGTVFELTESQTGWSEKSVYNFMLLDDGGAPYAGVMFDKKGTMFGAATTGGQGGSDGGGTVFKMTYADGAWNFATISHLAGWGLSGTFRNLMISSSGHIFATTHCDGTYSNGTIYELTPAAGGPTRNSTHSRRAAAKVSTSLATWWRMPRVISTAPRRRAGRRVRA